MGLVLGVTLAYFVKKVFTCPEGKVFALKEIISYLFLKIWRRLRPRRFDVYDAFDHKDVYRAGLLYPEQEVQLEHRRIHNDASDTVLIYGSNSSGDMLLVRVSAFQEHSTAIVYLYVSETQKEYVLPKEVLYKTSRSCFSAGGLRIQCLASMRRWRVSFNGMLNHGTLGEDDEHHVKFNFIWVAASNVFDATSDIHPELLSRYLALQKWDGWLPDVNKLQSCLDSYEQCGNLLGTISVGGEEEKEMYLWGYRLRSLDSHNPSDSEGSTHLFGYTNQGDSFHICNVKFQSTSPELQYGFHIYSNSLGCAIDSINGLPTDPEIQFTRDKKKFKVETRYTRKTLEKLLAAHHVTIDIVNIRFDGEECIGIRYSSARSKEPLQLPVMTPEISSHHTDAKVLHFLDPECKVVSLCGGKGASLATLAQLRANDFRVPTGVVITTNAYQDFTDSTDLERDISNMENLFWRKKDTNEKEFCQTLVERISNYPLPENVLKELNSKLTDCFGNQFYQSRFAVRSSATGEDSEELSAAGQMETFLGIKGFDQITKAIAKCWASQFAYTALEYKRRYGQLLNSPMAVVVQEMVPSEVSGVMFTCDPIDCNPSKVVITANYGLGESVVSGTVEPDTVTLNKTSDGKVTTLSEKLGGKKLKIVMEESEGVCEQTCSDSETKECCLTSDKALKLATIGVTVENFFGCPVDIEWAINANQISLLQARPVTTYAMETDFEIAREFDYSMRCEEDYVSKANVGEVVPGAISVLGGETMTKSLDLSSRRQWMKRNKKAMPFNPYVMKGLLMHYSQLFFGFLESILRVYKKAGESAATNAYSLAMCGKILDDPEMLAVALRRNQNYPPNSMRMMICLIGDFIFSGRRVRQKTAEYRNFSIEISPHEDATATFNKILSDLMVISRPLDIHGQCTLASSLINIVIMQVLNTAGGGWYENIYEDLARILSTCYDVESADVPQAVQGLSATIHLDNENFKKMSPEDALHWLSTSRSTSSDEFRYFLNKHGHRGIKEFDVLIQPWEENPLPLVKSLQELVGNVNGHKKKEHMDLDNTLDGISIPLNWKQRFVLKLVIPHTRKMVGLREQSKSLMIRMMHCCRKAYRILATKMVSEGRIPEQELLYFLSLNEIDTLLKTRSPKIIQKAVRRRNMFPILNGLRFPDTMKGIPMPIRNVTESIPEGNLVMKGTPVSRGIVQAKARIARTVDEASQIQAGEILIAYSTDIGWSPYFPVLVGIATELGGLISHGAVVAREYGLPCVVGVHGATNLFKTGDVVLLNGNTGELKRLEQN